MNYSDPQVAFEAATRNGKLSASETHPQYAGHFMYMGDNGSGQHLFKHRLTRKYIAPVTKD